MLSDSVKIDIRYLYTILVEITHFFVPFTTFLGEWDQNLHRTLQPTNLQNYKLVQIIYELVKLKLLYFCQVTTKKSILFVWPQDADQVISEMACDENLNVFAIMSQDSDFLIYQYPKQVHYLSGKHFDFRSLYSDRKSLRTYEYSRSDNRYFILLNFRLQPSTIALQGSLMTPLHMYWEMATTEIRHYQ